MACPQARDSIGKEVECEEIVITFPPELPLINIPSDLPPAERPECCIYRVPKQLRKVNEEAYTPKLVSIGPFHHCRKELRDMEMHKLRYLNDFLERTGKRQEDLLKIIKKNEEKIRHCYSEDDWRLESNDFVQMILLDAIFIIELFLKVRDQKKKQTKDEEEEEARGKVKKAEEEKDYILRKIWLGNGIYYDLILLENQLPFFVLEKLYKSAFNDSSSCNHCEEGKQIEEHKENLKKQDAPLVELSRNYFAYYDQQRKSIGEEVTEEPFDEEVTKKPIGEEVKHFTDLLRYLFCPPDMEQWTSEEGSLYSSKKEKRRKSGTRFCATKLDDAGLKLRVKDDSRLLDITLHGCCGRFPCFSFACLFACLPCLICLICFPSLTCLLGCFGCPMHMLEVPHLVIDYDTEAIFRNLMALEQCHYPSKTYICSYVLLLDRLIDTEKDVDLLVDKEIIANRLGNNDAVAILINDLGKQIVATTSSHDQITLQLNEHYQFPLNHFLATLKREYFPNVFRGTATVVGLIILGFTLWNFIRPFVV